MNLKKRLSIFLLTGVVSYLMANEMAIDFEKSIPELKLEHLSTWKIEKAKDAPSGDKVITMVENNRGFMGFGSGFNLYFTKDINFKDGEISVKFKANRGKIDQGGGIMWRVQDAKNYYIARFNPLEDNFRFYKVIDGDRIQLKSASLSLPKGWHSMKIVQKGDQFKGYIDGKLIFQARDNSISKGGGVGLWTKADAVTSFDDLTIKVEK